MKSLFLQLVLVSQTSFHKFKALLKKLLGHFCQCKLCHYPCERYSMICNCCQQTLPSFDLTLVDGDLLNWPAIHQLFAKNYFDQLVCLAPYQWPYGQWLMAMKYQRHFEYARLLARLWPEKQPQLCQALKGAQLIMPVPLHHSRLKQRLFNQAAAIAKPLAQALGVEYNDQLLVRHQATSSQVGQSGKERRRNLKSAFSVTEDISHLNHVVLLDDVITTGTTANVIARLLKSRGIEKVTVMAVCLSLPG
jgi:ComF family protein